MTGEILLPNFESIPWTFLRKNGKTESGLEDNDEFHLRRKWKVLRIDGSTKGETKLNFQPPGFFQPIARYHPVSEEWFRIVGEGVPADEQNFAGEIQYNIDRAGYYTWRPPGWVHDGHTVVETMGIVIYDGPASLVDVPKDMAGKNAMYPDDPLKAIGTRGYIKRLDTNSLPWIPMAMMPVISFSGGIHSLKYLSYKLLSFDVITGAQTLLIKLNAGYSDEEIGRTNHTLEMFVLSGALSMAEKVFGKYGYAYLPKGFDLGVLRTSSDQDCIIFLKSEGKLSFTH